MKEQIIMVQQKLAEKETKYINLDNELRTKKKEMEKLQRRLEDTSPLNPADLNSNNHDYK